MLGSIISATSTVISLYIMVVIAWVIISTLVGFNIINRYQPLTQKIMFWLDRLVLPALRPIQRVLPNMGGFDLSPIVLIILLTFLQQFIFVLIDARYGTMAFVNLISSLLMFYVYCVGIYAVLGVLINFRLVNPNQTLVSIVMSMLRALVNPPVIRLRRVFPAIGKVDLAPWILLAALLILHRALLQLLLM